jgi:hypothetical protein
MASRRRHLQALLYALPMLAVAVVGIAILGPGADRPYRVARVYAGPTQGVDVLPLHLVVVDRIGEAESPVAGRSVDVTVRAGAGKPILRSVTTDERGHAWPTFSLSTGTSPLEISVQDRGHDLGSGQADVSRDSWAARARGRSGFLKGKRQGKLRVDVTPERGVLAVPFRDHLIVQVSEDSHAVVGAQVSLAKEDGDSAPATTDAHGRARLRYLALEHALSVKVSAKADGGRSGWFWGALPVVPGAIDARLTDAGIRVESAISRDVAFLALLTDTGRRDHAAVALEPDGRGGSVGLWKVKPPKQQRAWCMVSSESDFNAPGTVGWPLYAPSPPALAETFAVADIELVDGAPARYLVQKARRLRARFLAGTFVIAAALLALALMALDSRLAGRELVRHLTAAGASPEELDQLTSKSLWPFVVLIALVSVLLGFALLALLILAQGM